MPAAAASRTAEAGAGSRCLAARGGGAIEPLPGAPAYAGATLSFAAIEVRDGAEFQRSCRSAQPPAAPRHAPRRADYVPSAAAPRITLAEPANYPRIMPAQHGNHRQGHRVCQLQPARPGAGRTGRTGVRPSRIIEAPELVPPPPALGGFLIEPVEEPANERRPGFEIPLQAAPMARRVAASAIDAFLVMSAFAAFAYIFFRFTAELPPLAKIAGAGVLLIGLMWSAYQYLLLVYSGTTPGLKLAKLELHRFDGSPVPLRLRRWRVLTSVLVRPVAGPGLRLVLPRRRPALLARSHYTNLYGAEEQVAAASAWGRVSDPSRPERSSASLCGAGAPPAWLSQRRSCCVRRSRGQDALGTAGETRR